MNTPRLRLLVLSVLTVLVTAGTTPAVAAGELKGLFRIDPTDCKAMKGSYFRMIDPGGGWVQNGSSACGDQTYTNLAPGRDGGLLTTGFQPHPDPAFDGGGNGANDRITQPQAFFGAKFATATNPTDPQTGVKVPVVVIRQDGRGGLSGDTRAFAASYQRQHFNQGAPKPDGSNPGRTKGVRGSYNAGTRRYTIEWASTIVGGPFNNFTGVWHFEGTFEKR